MQREPHSEAPWYSGITRYQWLVLTIACLGWIFDVFEGQLFAIFKTPALADVLQVAEDAALVDRYGNYGFASFLVGGAVGGLFFGMLADRIGRRQTMVWSILTYSVFSGMHFFATTWWHIVVLRFLVAMGVAGEWAIAASLVSEVFPKKARAMAGGIFHASSVIGAVLGSAVGMVFTAQTDWRWAFLLGVLPALLVVWVLVSIRESEKWETATAKAEEEDKRGGNLEELLGAGPWRSRALLGLGLAAVGLGTYWGIYAWGPELVREILQTAVPPEEARSKASFAYMLMNFTGGLAGLLLFAPISMWTSRRMAFVFYHAGAIVVVPITFLGATTYWQALVLLPLTAFFVVGMHAGYAIYFPELFPTRLRATGASFCFNVGRLVSAIMLMLRGELRDWLGLRYAVTAMASLFFVGLVLLYFAPETKDQDLPE
ncbi:MAG TPA: MFS transporter [Planctomycetaceae bacterium]|nr:MFS transporter [Planctomycetaceae bacterium]